MNTYLSRTLPYAIRMAALAHAEQVDKAGHPYILHPLRVMLRFEDDVRRTVAVLHDIVEDTSVTLPSLRLQGYPEEVVGAIDALTRREGETYFDSIRRATLNPIARDVKIADVRDNLDRIAVIPDEKERDGLRKRYEKALLMLESLDTTQGQ